METHNYYGATRIPMGNDLVDLVKGYRGKLEYSKYQMLPTAETGDANLHISGAARGSSQT